MVAKVGRVGCPDGVSVDAYLDGGGYALLPNGDFRKEVIKTFLKWLKEIGLYDQWLADFDDANEFCGMNVFLRFAPYEEWLTGHNVLAFYSQEVYDQWSDTCREIRNMLTLP